MATIRFWGNTINQVCSRYLSSAFMGQSTAEDMEKENFLEVTSKMKGQPLKRFWWMAWMLTGLFWNS